MELGGFRSLAAILVCAAALHGQRLDIRSVEIDGHRISYEAAGGLAIAQGDIILGTLEEVESKSSKVRDAAIVVSALGLPIPWTDGIIYYTIDVNIPNQRRVTEAIEHWNTRTSVRLVPRTGQINYVQFRRAGDEGRCASSAGMVGGRQIIDTGDGCPLGAMIHEIGHAAGLMHEQLRPDRNAYITVLYENIDPDFADQFHQGPETVARGYYDYDSIMHYSARAASTNRNASMVTVPPGIPIGQIDGLSAGDIDAIERMYGVIPSHTTIATIPAGLSIQVDGADCVAPCSYAWGPGQTHTLAVNQRQGTAPRYTFVRWSDDSPVSSTGQPQASRTITTSTDRTVFAAIFRGEQPMLTGVASGSGSVTVDPPSPSGDSFYPTGTPLRITAAPSGSQRFFNWSGTPFESTGSGRGTESGLLRLYSGADFRANFTASPVTTITSDPPGRPVTVDGTFYLTPVNFTWEAGTQHTIDAERTDFSTTGAVQYSFDGWEDGNSSTSRTVQATQGGTTHKATYRVSYFLSLDWSGSGFLISNPSSQDGYYNGGSEVTVEAITGGGQVVQYWLGDTAGGGNTKTLLMDRHKLAFATIGQPVAFRPVNAASYLANTVFNEPATVVAPLEIVTIFGDNVGPANPTPGSIGGDGLVATSAGGTRVLFDNTPAPILYTSATQTSVVVPANVAGKTAVVIRIERDGVSGTPVLASVVATLPGLFTADASGRGRVATINPGPVDRGSTIVIYASGAGLMDRSVPDGSVVGADLPRPIAPVYVRIGGQPAEIAYAGGGFGLVHGALQINVKVPELLLPGEQPIQLIVGNWASPPGTTIAVK